MTSQSTGIDCPYVGLRPFEAEHRAYFFGRERDQRLIIANLLAAPLTILYGASGVGKSSVLMAGAIPQLHRDRPRTPVVLFRDWARPDFAEALATRCIEAAWASVPNQPKPALSLPLDEILRECGEAANATVLVIFDQFEEYFLYNPKSSDPDSFEVAFARAVNREDVDVGFLVALREDGLTKLDRFQERIPNLLGNRLCLHHLGKAGATTAIREPLRVWNETEGSGQPPMSIEDALVEELIAQVGIGKVKVGQSGGSGGRSGVQTSDDLIEAPFLQLVLTRLWAEERRLGSTVLRLATLTRLDGAEAIVRGHLDDAMRELDEASRAACARIFDRLVTPSGAKIACSESDLLAFAGPLAAHVPLQALCDARFRILRATAGSPDRADETHYEIFHDVLAPAILDWRARFVAAEDQAKALREARDAASRKSARLAIVILSSLLPFALAGWGLAFYKLRAVNWILAGEQASKLVSTEPREALWMAVDAAEELVPPIETAPPALENALRRAVQPAVNEKLTLDNDAYDVAYHPTQPLVAVATQNEAQLWSLSSEGTAKIIARFPTDEAKAKVWRVAFIGAGDRLVTSAAKTAYLWDVANETTPLARFDNGSDISTALAVSRKGQMLATYSDPGSREDRAIKVWSLDPPSAEPIATIPLDGAWVKGLDFSPDGCCIATAAVQRGGNGRSWNEVWSIATQAKILSLPCTGPGDAVAFTPDGKALVTAGRDALARIWRPAEGDLAAILAERATRPPAAPATDATTQSFASECPQAPPETIPWSVQVLAGHEERIRDVAVSEDSLRVASSSADHTLRLWDAQTGKNLAAFAGHDDWVEGVTFSPDGQFVASASRDNTVRLWKVANHTGSVNGIAFSRDGQHLATASGDRTVRIWAIEGGDLQLSRILSGFDEAVYRVAFSDDGTLLATADFDGDARIWNVASGTEVHRFEGHSDQLRDIAFGKGDTLVLTASADGSARLWSAGGGDTPVATVSPGGGQVFTAFFDPRGDAFLTAGDDGTIRRWDFTGKELGRISTPKGGRIIWADISADGRTIAAISGRQLLLWPASAFGDGRAPTLCRPLDPDQKPPLCSTVAFNADGSLVATACTDGTARIYDVASCAEVKSINVHTDSVQQVVFSPDGRMIATASRDRTFNVSPLDLDELIDLAKARLAEIGPPTDEEAH
jgi:FOG: WD40 repeat